jgi:hypothetical protein
MADILNKLNSANYVTVKVTDNAIVNGNNLLAAYELAKTITPNGAALSDSNRLAVILPPAKYDLGTQSLILDTEYIDIFGSTSDRSKHYITSNVGVINRGTVQQTANDVKLFNLTIENSNVTYAGGVADFTDPAGYFPSSNLANAYLENIKIICPDDINDNNHCYSMRIGIIYSGTYIDCSAGNYAFGGVVNSGSTTLSGTFTNCTGEYFSFGGINSGGTSLLSGTFTNCRGSFWSFGGANNNVAGTLSGNFVDCTCPDGSYSFGSCTGAGGSSGLLSGTFTNCTGDFGASYGEGQGGLLSGTFTNCKGYNGAFGGSTLPSYGGRGGILSGTFVGCTGGDYSFGSSYEGEGGVLSGTFIGCNGGDFSFASANANVGGTITSNANLTNCVGGDYSFASGFNQGGTINGTLTNCTGGDYSFAGPANSIIGYTAILTNCNAGISSFGGSIDFLSELNGTFKNCNGGVGSFNL